jgi:hypothetical protein
MNIATKYINRDEYDRDWEPKYQNLEKKYFNEEGNPQGDATEYNSDIEKLDYYYAKAVSQRMRQKMLDIMVECKSALERNDYNDFEIHFQALTQVWNDFNTPFHYKMNARSILERV